jgi:P-type Cu+ transporter
VDPLRAGHVAILEGRGFHYFCNAACKQDYLRVHGRAPEEDVPTASPPEVAYVFPVANEVGTVRPTLPSVGAPSSSGEVVVESGPRTVPPVGLDTVVPVASAVAASGPPPALQTIPEAFLRSIAPAEAATPAPSAGTDADEPAPRREASSDTTTVVIDSLGIVAGAFAPTIGLLGSVADVARLPLVVFAWAALALRVQRGGRDPSDPHALVVLAPTGAATVAACWAQAVSDPHAMAIAVFAGLASAVAIAVETTVSRARAQVQAARERIERALDARVRAIQGDDAIDLPSSDVRPGEQVVAEAGELVGVDAIVTAGEARVVPWLGAGIETTKREGDPLVAGARVVTSRLRMTTTWSGRDRAWVRLLTVPSSRIDVAAPTVRILRHTVERGVPVAAVAVGAATFVAGGKPVEVLAGMAAGAMAFAAKSLVSLGALHYARAHLEALASGITYKDPRAFERAGSANIVVLSARGTVLLGEPEIVAIEPITTGKGKSGKANGQSEPESGREEQVARVLSLAAGAETASTHPFAAAILRAARTKGAQPDPVRNAAVHAGLGVTALSSTGERLVVGGRTIMLGEKIGVAVADARVTELEAQGRSVLLVAVGDRLVGLIALQDGLRAGARGAIQRLLDARIEPVLMSGEARDTCETIGRALDIEHIRPGVLPADRGPEVRALGEGGGVVAVVGHPVSDDGALGAADVSIAMGAAGSTPGEWTVALASDDVRDAAISLAIPHATRARIRVAMVLGATPGLVALLAMFFGVAPFAVAPLAVLVGAVAVAVHARESAG